MNLTKNQLKEKLRLDPFNSKINELLAYELANEGDFEKAHELLLIANQDKNSSAESNFYLGLSYSRKFEYEKSIEYIQLSLKKNGIFYEGLNELAINYAHTKNFEKSEEIFLKLLNIYPENKLNTTINIGKLKSKQKEYNQAVYYFNEALKISPKSESVLLNLSTALYDLGKYQNSLKILYKVIEYNNKNEDAMLNIAATLNALGEYSKSMEWSYKLIDNNQLAMINFAESLSGLGKYNESLDIYNKFNNKSKYYTKAINNKGVIYDKLYQYENALKCFEEIININDSEVEAFSNKAKILNELNIYDKALESINNAILIDNKNINCHILKAFILFNMDDYKNGWIEYEWRNYENISDDSLIEKLKRIEEWNGVNKDKKIIIWGEQGLGDQILFSSVLTEIRNLKIYPTVLVSKKIVNVFKYSFPEFNIKSKEELHDINNYGYQISMISLQKHFRSKIYDFKKIKTPYIKYIKDNNILRNIKKTKVGISWLSFSDEIGEYKSIPLDEFSILFNNDKINFIDIQYYPPNKKKEIQSKSYKIENIKNANYYEDFELLVQIIDNCDIIITCSNTTAHIAGAMGKITYLILPISKGRHWYWKNIEGKSIFYPTVTVLEQKIKRKWYEPIQELKDILEKIN